MTIPFACWAGFVVGMLAAMLWLAWQHEKRLLLALEEFRQQMRKQLEEKRNGQ